MAVNQTSDSVGGSSTSSGDESFMRLMIRCLHRQLITKGARPFLATPTAPSVTTSRSRPSPAVRYTSFLRNRKTVPLEMPTGPEDAQGGEKDPALFSREAIARMVTDWHVYDAFGVDADQEPLPATPRAGGQLPVEIRTTLSKALSPDPTPAG